MTTLKTAKKRLVLAIGLRYVMALRAFSRRVASLDLNGDNSCEFTFVFNKRFQLSKCPSAMLRSVWLSNSRLASYSLEILKANERLLCLSFQNELFTGAMIFIFAKAGFFLSQLFKMSFSRFSMTLLKCPFYFMVTLSYFLNRLAAKVFSGRIGEKLYYSKISADGIINLLWSWLRYFTTSQQIELPFVKYKIRFTLSGFKKFLLSLTTLVRDMLPAFDSANGEELLFASICQDAVIECNRAERLEGPFCLGLQLISVSHFCNATNNNLSRKPRLFANGLVGDFVQSELSEDLTLPGNITDIIASRIGFLKRFFQKPGLLFGWLKLDLSYQFHAENYVSVQINFKVLKGGNSSPTYSS